MHFSSPAAHISPESKITAEVAESNLWEPARVAGISDPRTHQNPFFCKITVSKKFSDLKGYWQRACNTYVHLNSFPRMELNKSPVGHTRKCCLFLPSMPWRPSESTRTYFTSTTDDQHGSTVQGAQRLPPCHIQPQATWTHGYGLLWCHKCTRISKQGIGGCRRSEEEEYTEYKITMVGCTKNKKGNEQKKMRPLPWGMMMTRDSLHTLGAGKPAGFVSRWNNGLLFHLFHRMISERSCQEDYAAATSPTSPPQVLSQKRLHEAQSRITCIYLYF